MTEWLNWTELPLKSSSPIHDFPWFGVLPSQDASLWNTFFPIRNSPCSHQTGFLRLLVDCRKLRGPEISFWMIYAPLVHSCAIPLNFLWSYKSGCYSLHVPKVVTIILFKRTLSTFVQVYNCSEITLLQFLEVLLPSWENLLVWGLNKGSYDQIFDLFFTLKPLFIWESCACWRAWKYETVLLSDRVSLDWKFCSHIE